MTDKQSYDRRVCVRLTLLAVLLSMLIVAVCVDLLGYPVSNYLFLLAMFVVGIAAFIYEPVSA